MFQMTHRLQDKLIRREQLAQRANWYRSITLLSGCFDLLHSGHIRLIEQARRMNSPVWVAINSDESIRRLKGEMRPIMHQEERACLLAALTDVAAVTIFDEDDPSEVIKIVRPLFFVKGGDYSADGLPERPLVESLGGNVVILNYHLGYSTTNLVERIKRSH